MTGAKTKKLRRLPSKKKKLIILGIILLTVIIGWAFVTRNVNPILQAVSEETVRELATVAINDAAELVITDTGHTHADFVEITQDANGNIEMMRVNSLLLNTVSRRIATQSQNNISELGDQRLSVPVGTLSGLTFLTGRGPNINIRIHPVGAVEIIFNSQFTSAGINQTRHTIYLIIVAELSVIMPGMRDVTAQTEVILCESIIVGQIPDAVLQFGIGGGVLNLVP